MDYVEENIPIPYQILIALSEICEVSTDCLLGLKSKSREKDLNNVLPFRYDYRIAKRIRKLCQESNVDTKSSFLENLLCLSSKEVFYLIEYGFIPHMDTLIKLADYCTDLLIFNQIILVITVVLMYNKRNGGDSYGKTKKVQYPSYGK